MPVIPYTISMELIQSLQAIIPDGYRIDLIGSGRTLLVDCPIGTMTCPCFLSVFYPLQPKRAIVRSAECAMSVVEDFVTEHEGSRIWIDPEGLATGPIIPRARIFDGILQMAYVSDTNTIRILEEVRIKESI